MKIIEALKKIKDLHEKVDDLCIKINRYSADLDCETPIYPDQRKKVQEFVQSAIDSVKEISRLRFCLMKTNIQTPVAIDFGNKIVTKSIYEWMQRRQNLAAKEGVVWRSLDDKKHKSEYKSQLTPNSPAVIIKQRLYFDPELRDEMVERCRKEPGIIDSTLEVVNAVTDLIE